MERNHRLGRWPAPPHFRRGLTRVRYGHCGIALAVCAVGRLRTTGTVLTWLDPRWLPCPSSGRVAPALLWASEGILIVLPIAEHDYTYRYVLPVVPLACIAAAIALRKPGHETAQT